LVSNHPCKKEPRNPRISAEKFLAFHAFLLIRISQESLGFPGKPGDSPLSTISTLSTTYWNAWKSKRLHTFGAFKDSTVSWKARNHVTPKSLGEPEKPGRNASLFPGFILCVKKRGKPGMIPNSPGFCGFLESAEFHTQKAWKSMEIQENIPCTFLAFPCMQKNTNF